MNSLTIARNMIKRKIGTRKGLMGFLILPCLVVSAVIFLMGGDGVTRSTILYVNHDNDIAGQHMEHVLAGKADYQLKQVDTEAELRDEIVRQKGEAGFVIPKGFTSSLLKGETPQVPVYKIKDSEADAALRLEINGIVSGIQQTSRLLSGEQTDQAKEKLNEVLQEVEKGNVQAVKTDLGIQPKPGLYSITGFTLLFLMGLISSTVTLIIEDRTEGTMARMFTAPVRSWEIALGNFLGSCTVGILQILIILSLSRYVLGYDYQVPFLPHFLVLAAFMLVAMGIASTVGGMVRSPQTAGTINTLILTPTCMLGGCFWPLSIMPDFMQRIADFIPQKWAIEAVDKMSAGGGWSSIGFPMLILGLMAVLLLAVGSVVLRPSSSRPPV
ncbi:ABC transporter permease [Paenibacillus sp. CAA11]|uniref:ABC transporter permease n=1 Tax=Paenibacillus sp. CAA11 TaxID=1532905 RepID=UPI000D36FAB8|nr:ABC transporter permease [Paenibacillus sp. CAA11]AWB43209.1 ABC transporter permease [Paenibacillus sp. CAA11]